MDIKQMTYLVEVVNNKFNISAASEKLYISQPALSQSIKRIEQIERINIFHRQKGYLVGLTEVGETLYLNALKVLAANQKLQDELQQSASKLSGSIRIGIPPLILTVLFTKFLSELISDNQGALFNIVEAGAYDLKRQLLTEEIDCAILLKPTDLNPSVFHEILLFENTLNAFVSSKHRLAQKDELNWSDLQDETLVIFDNTYMIHHKLVNKFKSLGMAMKVSMMSKSWDFLLESVRMTNVLTILPSPVSSYYNLTDVVEKRFAKPIPWQVVFVYPKKNHYSRLERLTQQAMLNAFTQ